MATSTVEKTKEQVGLEKQSKIAIEKEPEQQVEDEQWEFIRYEVEKMKEAREIAQKEQQACFLVHSSCFLKRKMTTACH